MTTAPSAFNVMAQAGSVARTAAARAGVRVTEAEDVGELRAVSQLFEAVWGRSDEGVPLPSEVLRSLVHAGGAVTVARGAGDALAGAAVLVLAPDQGTYSLIAAAAPGGADRGVGHALKLHQRNWALARGLETMTWTFDPLVRRNARFNLTKLGARAAEYVPSFYGRMVDEINRDDEADRLVASWRLASPAAIGATEGTRPHSPEPDLAAAEVVRLGPDAAPHHLRDAAGADWIRVPGDIVALRQAEPARAQEWRRATRAAFQDALARGLVATAMTAAGWYRLETEEPA